MKVFAPKMGHLLLFFIKNQNQEVDLVCTILMYGSVQKIVPDS